MLKVQSLARNIRTKAPQNDCLSQIRPQLPLILSGLNTPGAKRQIHKDLRLCNMVLQQTNFSSFPDKLQQIFSNPYL